MSIPRRLWCVLGVGLALGFAVTVCIVAPPYFTVPCLAVWALSCLVNGEWR